MVTLETSKTNYRWTQSELILLMEYFQHFLCSERKWVCAYDVSSDLHRTTRSVPHPPMLNSKCLRCSHDFVPLRTRLTTYNFKCRHSWVLSAWPSCDLHLSGYSWIWVGLCWVNKQALCLHSGISFARIAAGNERTAMLTLKYAQSKPCMLTLDV